MSQADAEARSSLQRRRDELAARVADLHRDLGGLAYEMAIRDHFRLDVLRQQAAALQEQDAELAEIERRLQHEYGVRQAPSTGVDDPQRDGRTLPGNGIGTGVTALLVLVVVPLMLGIGAFSGAFASGNGATRGHRGHLTLMLPTAQAAATVTPDPVVSSTTPPPVSAEPTPAGAEAHESTSTPKQGSEAPPSAQAEVPASSPRKASKPAAAPNRKSALPPVKHVFLIVLADQPYASTFGPESAAPYLSGTLEKRGELLARYYAVAHDELANEIALISGLGPTADTALNCPSFQDVTPALAGKDGQYSGNGCVYPSTVQSLGDQLHAKRLSWRVYAEDMDHAGPGEAKVCRHPAFGSNDPTATARAGDAFATYRDPFSYFDSVIDAPSCAGTDTSLAALEGDLAQAKRTPALSYIVPNLCHDGHETPCTPGAPAGLGAADSFLRRVVPKIMASPAYKQGGLLAITTDQAPASGPHADSSSCCAQPSFPAIAGAPAAAPGSLASKLPPAGGGQVGALLLSPYVKAHSFNQEEFNHFSLLATIENLFGLSHLGYAGLKGVGSFGATVFSAYSPG